jgi:hypothetical protein
MQLGCYYRGQSDRIHVLTRLINTATLTQQKYSWFSIGSGNGSRLHRLNSAARFMLAQA